jgi:toxin FitB
LTGGARYLLDINVVSETRRVRADPSVMAFLSTADASSLFISVLTLGELQRGVVAKRRTDPLAADRLGVWVEGIERMFADRILPVDAATARRWGELSAGRSLPVIDTLIAATALVGDLVLVSRNTRDLQTTGATIIDPWQVDANR